MGFSIGNILSIGIGVAVGFAAPFLAPGLFASGVFGAVPLFSWAAAGVGFTLGSIVSSAFLQQKPELPTTGTIARQSLANVRDPETPWTYVYGRRLVGWSWAFEEVWGKRDERVLLAGVIADHPCEEILGVRIGDDFLPLGSASGLVLNTEYLGTDPSNDTGRENHPYWQLPGDWYVPGVNSKYRTVFQGTRWGGVTAWHVAFKFDLGGQTTHDTFFDDPWPGEGEPATRYGAHNRVFGGKTCFRAIFVTNSNLQFQGRVPELNFLIKGKNDVWDPRIPGNAYTQNGLLVLVDYLKWKLGKTNADFGNTNVASNADLLDVDVPGETGFAKGDISAFITSDQAAEDVIPTLLRHFGGGLNERGDLVRFWVGAPRASVMDLTSDDYLAPDAVMVYPELEDAERVNTLVPHSVAETTPDGDHVWQSKPGPAITTAAWVTNDGGEVLRTDIQFPYFTKGRRAQYWAWVWAQQQRGGERLVAIFRAKTLQLEKGDVIRLTDDDLGFVNKEFWVQDIAKEWKHGRATITLRGYQDAFYTPGAALTDEPIGNLPVGYDGTLPKVTGLALTVLDAEAHLDAEGRLSLECELTWTPVDNDLVTDGGSYRVRYQKGSGPKRSASTDGDAPVKQLTLKKGETYTFWVRATTAFGKGPWSEPFVVLIDSQVTGLNAPPIDGTIGANQVTNQVAQQSSVHPDTEKWGFVNDQGAAGWRMIDPTHGGVLLAKRGWFARFDTTSPNWPAGSLFQLQTGDGTEGLASYVARPEFQIPVTPGDIMFAKIGRIQTRTATNTGDSTFSYWMRWVDETGATVHQTLIGFKSSTESGIQSIRGYVQVPQGLAVVAVFPEVVADAGAVGEVTGWNFSRVTLNRATRFPASRRVSRSGISDTTTVPPDQNTSWHRVVAMRGDWVYPPADGARFGITAGCLCTVAANTIGVTKQVVRARLTRYTVIDRTVSPPTLDNTSGVEIVPNHIVAWVRDDDDLERAFTVSVHGEDEGPFVETDVYVYALEMRTGGPNLTVRTDEGHLTIDDE